MVVILQKRSFPPYCCDQSLGSDSCLVVRHFTVLLCRISTVFSRERTLYMLLSSLRIVSAIFLNRIVEKMMCLSSAAFRQPCERILDRFSHFVSSGKNRCSDSFQSCYLGQPWIGLLTEIMYFSEIEFGVITWMLSFGKEVSNSYLSTKK